MQIIFSRLSVILILFISNKMIYAWTCLSTGCVYPCLITFIFYKKVMNCLFLSVIIIISNKSNDLIIRLLVIVSVMIHVHLLI